MPDTSGVYVFRSDGFWWKGSHQSVPPAAVGLTVDSIDFHWTDNISLLTTDAIDWTWSGGVTDNGDGTWTG